MSDDSPYNKREQDMLFHQMREEINFQFDAVITGMKKIEVQTTKTNGRITALEKWRWVITGGVVALALSGSEKITDVISKLVVF